MPTRILIADAHALVREGLKQLARDAVPDALPVLCDDLRASLADGGDDAGFAAAIVAFPFVSVVDLASFCAGRPATAVIVLCDRAEPALLRALLDAGAAALVPRSAPADIVGAALKLSLAGGVVLRAAGDLAPAARRASRAHLRLTPRQVEVLRLVAQGRGNRDIAASLGLGVRTIKGHVAILLSALNAGNRREAAARARRWLAKDDSLIR